jgi:alpha-beta hydrolase superfamily lysophospholipase
MGQSMGGMTSYFLALRNKSLFQGVILMAPSLRNILGGVLVSFMCSITSILPKSMKLFSQPCGMVTKNPKVAEDIINDKLMYSGRMYLQTAQTIVHTMDIAH